MHRLQKMVLTIVGLLAVPFLMHAETTNPPVTLSGLLTTVGSFQVIIDDMIAKDGPTEMLLGLKTRLANLKILLLSKQIDQLTTAVGGADTAATTGTTGTAAVGTGAATVTTGTAATTNTAAIDRCTLARTLQTANVTLYKGMVATTWSPVTTQELIKKLQQFLNLSGAPVAVVGEGSLNYESNSFGTQTEAAVQKWQAAHGVVSGGTPATTGYGKVGSATRAAFVTNACGTIGAGTGVTTGTTGTAGTGTTGTTGTGVTTVTTSSVTNTCPASGPWTSCVITNGSGIALPEITTFAFDKSELYQTETNTLRYRIWAPGINVESKMRCNISVYDPSRGQTMALGSTVSGAQDTSATFTAAGYPSGATAYIACATEGGEVRKSANFTVNNTSKLSASRSWVAWLSDVVEFSWTPVSGTTKYKIKIDGVVSGPFDAYTSWQGTLAQLGVTTKGNHTFSLQACNAQNVCGDFGNSVTIDVRSTDTSTVASSKPTSGPTISVDKTAVSSLEEPIAFSWTGVSLATDYKVRLDGGDPVSLGAFLSWPGSLTELGITTGGPHTISLQACNAAGCGPFGNTVTITLEGCGSLNGQFVTPSILDKYSYCALGGTYTNLLLKYATPAGQSTYGNWNWSCGTYSCSAYLVPDAQ